uniref:Uncharacterized protein n=1 Tax=Setaria viridis TaxID=4556 RepID=A0A4U6T434_SETVI|nr:uncharacterized protein LOC117836539 [Setaria viridis]TKV96410.1 hypothetical protein SEVIR_9G426400v2 [Setaria viridis]
MRQRTRAMQRASPRARPHLGPAHTRTLPRRAPPLHRALLALPARARHRMPASTPLAAPHADEHSTALSRACLVVPLPRRPHACASRRTTPPCAPPATARRPPLLWPIKDRGVTEEEESEEELGGQYHKPEPEDPYREQELPEGSEDEKDLDFVAEDIE